MEKSTLALNGSGSGYQNGSGCGLGNTAYGDAYGNGFGGGRGGTGYGYGDGHNNEGVRAYIKALLATHVSNDGITAFWRCGADNYPTNGGSASQPAVAGAQQVVDGPLRPCSKNALHGTHSPDFWVGSHWWLVLLHHPVNADQTKLASLKRTFIRPLGRCPF